MSRIEVVLETPCAEVGRWIFFDCFVRSDLLAVDLSRPFAVFITFVAFSTLLARPFTRNAFSMRLLAIQEVPEGVLATLALGLALIVSIKEERNVVAASKTSFTVAILRRRRSLDIFVGLTSTSLAVFITLGAG